jgi:hypothetical protein
VTIARTDDASQSSPLSQVFKEEGEDGDNVAERESEEEQIVDSTFFIDTDGTHIGEQTGSCYTKNSDDEYEFTGEYRPDAIAVTQEEEIPKQAGKKKKPIPEIQNFPVPEAKVKNPVANPDARKSGVISQGKAGVPKSEFVSLAAGESSTTMGKGAGKIEKSRATHVAKGPKSFNRVSIFANKVPEDF